MYSEFFKECEKNVTKRLIDFCNNILEKDWLSKLFQEVNILAIIKPDRTSPNAATAPK